MVDVNLSVGSVAVGNVQTAPSFEITDNGGKLGELIVCKGGLYWKTKNARKWVQVSWWDFDKFVNELNAAFPQTSVNQIEQADESIVQSVIPEIVTPSFFGRLFGKKK